MSTMEYVITYQLYWLIQNVLSNRKVIQMLISMLQTHLKKELLYKQISILITDLPHVFAFMCFFAFLFFFGRQMFSFS